MSDAVAKRVARHMWIEAGRPEKDSEPTSVGRAWYEDRSAEVVAALGQLGYRITRPREAKKAPMRGTAQAASTSSAV